MTAESIKRECHSERMRRIQWALRAEATQSDCGIQTEEKILVSLKKSIIIKKLSNGSKVWA